MITATTHKDLEPVLMEPKAPGIKEPYLIIKSENEENITVLSSGKNGVEYNKTLGYFHTYPGVEVYHCVYGQGIMIMQRNDANGDVKEVKVAGIRPGSVIEVPSGWGHALINTGKNLLVVVDNAPHNAKTMESDSVKEKQGFAYYIIDKKGNIAFEENPSYPYHPQISTY